ncbi:laminin subunit beta-1-like isoform X1 [Carassius gibelio]|uniref:laminin subunit beta-1-like isoform X1 n=1 Tax=Carassius gibelio TaxID=101364 RepID=UPI0022779F7C|nr:laminin subunit beta-1-like isoform X1 [Carassius gibelio]
MPLISDFFSTPAIEYYLRKEANDMKYTAEMVKEALQEAYHAQSSVTEALKQATADIKGTQHLLVSVVSRLQVICSKGMILGLFSTLSIWLLKLQSDVALVKEKAINTSTSAINTEKEADSIHPLADQLKKILRRVMMNIRSCWRTSQMSWWIWRRL